MDLIHVVAALLSALLHAGWNAAVKRHCDPAGAMTAQMLIGAVLSVPCLALTGLPDPGAWIWIAASTLTNIVTVLALLRAYELGGFGIVYPIVRAVAVLLVVPLAALVAGDRLGIVALGGIAIITLSLMVLSYDAGRGQGLAFRALGWALLAGLGTAIYVMCDARGVRASGSPWAYGFAVSITNALAMWWRQRRAGSPWQQMVDHWAVALPAAIASMASYLLILWVWSLAPIAPAAALRDTSAAFAIVIAVFWLREPFTRARVVAVLLAAAAVPLLRFD
jgi:drug/metabolite transporter (DMT)-like permease